jgi:hypothetical protein
LSHLTVSSAKNRRSCDDGRVDRQEPDEEPEEQAFAVYDGYATSGAASPRRVRGAFGRFLEWRWAMALVTAVGAVVAAVVVQLIGGWDWSEFWQDIAKNVFIAAVVTVGAASIKRYQEDRQRRRADAAYVSVRSGWLKLIVTGWSDAGEMTADNETLGSLAAQRLSEFDSLNTQISVALGSEEPAGTYIGLQGLRWPLAEYISEGARQRRRRYLAPLLVDLAVLESSPDKALAGASVRARSRAIRTLGVMDHTATLIAERLLVERTTPILTIDVPETSLLFDGIAELSPAAIASDPCYLVLCHLDQILARVPIDGGGISDDHIELLHLLQKQMGRVLHAIQRETAALAALIEDLLQLHSAAQQLR